VKTYGDLLKFILDNRNEHVFQEDINTILYRLSHSDYVFYSTDKSGEIDGIVVASKLNDNVIFVEDCLATSLSAMKKFFKFAKTRFCGHKIEGNRKGKLWVVEVVAQAQNHN
jgi:hypothetical protein